MAAPALTPMYHPVQPYAGSGATGAFTGSRRSAPSAGAATIVASAKAPSQILFMMLPRVRRDSSSIDELVSKRIGFGCCGAITARAIALLQCELDICKPRTAHRDVAHAYCRKAN